MENYYILSTPASGKSHFIITNKGEYNEYRIHDFDNLRPRDYRAFDKYNFTHMDVIFGGISGLNLEFDINKCNYIAVLIDIDILKRNVEFRRKNPSTSLDCGWSKIENIIKAHEELRKFCINNNIFMFKTFEDALGYIRINHEIKGIL